MPDCDAIVLAAFDDDPDVASPATPGPRPAHRPRTGSAGQPSTEPITLVLVDSDARCEPAPTSEPGQARPRLAVDIGVLDPRAASFLVVYAAGTPLDALGPRTIALPSWEAGPPVTRLELQVRKPAEPRPAPFLTFECPQDIRGRQLTLRFSDPTDLRSVVVQCNPPRATRQAGNGQAATAAAERGVDVPMSP